ncbi:hypothetical protein YK48G_10570 [Lentilactobacillus fungorum]|uniref:Uncharacterized protein n=1 Tax=Lentilactobacillus fungorum TaxID=2201250 RepID=A0ABQ3VZC0_9LACO|nr:hypothetical protein [Lentilactobacillus fungorum]GHP13632.1 hypothetical protein YK48G_10570 [Lentilactobacillus fungorum]
MDVVAAGVVLVDVLAAVSVLVGVGALSPNSLGTQMTIRDLVNSVQ